MTLFCATQGLCQSFAHGIKGLIKACDTRSQHQHQYCKDGRTQNLSQEGGEGAWTPAAGSWECSSGCPVKNGDSDQE